MENDDGPRAQKERPSHPSSRPARLTPADGTSRLRVLVVDDDHEFCSSLRRVLARWGYEPRVAESGLEALELCDAQMPDAAIIDIMMPGMDGWQLSKKLVSTPVPPIMVLVSGQFEREELHLDATVVATLPKPLDLERLRGLLAQAFARRGWSTA